MSSMALNKKPRVAVVGNVKYVGDDYLKSVKAELDIEVGTELMSPLINLSNDLCSNLCSSFFNRPTGNSF